MRLPLLCAGTSAAFSAGLLPSVALAAPATTPQGVPGSLWTLALLVIPALISGGVGLLYTRFVLKPYEERSAERLEHIKSDLAKDRDELKSLRGRVDAQQAKRFDVLHDRRAEAMLETYAALCDLKDAADALSGALVGFTNDPLPNERWSQLTEAGTAFRNAFWNRQILFEKDLADDLRALNQAYISISNTYGRSYYLAASALTDDQRKDQERQRHLQYDALSDLLQSKAYQEAYDQIPVLRQRVEVAFRDLFGVQSKQ